MSIGTYPTTQSILKISDVCNLNCPYCYYFTPVIPDHTRQRCIHDKTLEQFFQRVKSHCSRYHLAKFGILLHGGEPLIAGHQFIDRMFSRANEILGDSVQIEWTVQTNGVLLDSAFVKLFLAHDVGVGVSLDGTPESHDKTRVFHNGRGSSAITWRRLKDAIALGLKPGVLCVINPSEDGATIYHTFRELGITAMDFLPMDYSYDTLPEDIARDLDAYNEATFKYMREVFDAWIAEDNPHVHVRYFEELITSLLGGDVQKCTMRAQCPSFMTIEVDGSFNGCDVLRQCGASNYKTGLNVYRDEIAALRANPFHQLVTSLDGLGPECRACEFLPSCGGHCPTSRYSSANGVLNVSVHCGFFKRIIPYVQAYVSAASAREPVLK